ncbi:hypothetical protein [Tsukamurella pseudospumae]|uniref:HicA protein n=1 Tax=Tsukamurella pseudospumae TaxID=239498 RepID=A0A138A8C8_9ACTN|nr:hypothetical protein [Tsukamurella pseudospumae]KXP06729.1 hypothetical protein AXK60_11740 [Tsukamurella pseudospumae]
MDKDIADIIAWAEANQWTVKTTGDGYKRFYDPDDNYIVEYPNTPSNARRRMAALKVKLKNAGLQVPPPSKKEQRAMRNKLKKTETEGE